MLYYIIILILTGDAYEMAAVDGQFLSKYVSGA
jgi:hypothetical protein